MTSRHLVILYVAGLLFSCDPVTQIRYSVVNETSNDLNLIVTPPSGAGLGASYDLKPSDEITIFADESVGYASDIIKKKAMNSDFLNCLTLKKDSASLTFVRNSSVWTSENIGDTLAKYRLIITPDILK